MNRAHFHTHDPTPDGQAGFVLVAVLGFLLIVAAVVAPFAVVAKTELLLQSNLRRQLQLDLVADTVARHLVTKLFSSQETPATGSPVASFPQSFTWCSTRTHQFGYRVQPQSGLVDLNAAEPVLLTAGLRAIGLPEHDASILGDHLARFRSYDPYAQSDDGQDAIVGGYKHAPFESVSELSDFRGLAGYSIEDFHQVFTVHSKRGNPDIHLAPQRLRQTLQAETSEQQGGSTAGASAYAIIVVSKRNAAPLAGYSGFIFVGASGDGASPRPVEPLPRADIELPEQGTVQSCRNLIDDALVTLIEQAAS